MRLVGAQYKGSIMMYNEKLAVAIKSAGKVLREFKDTIYVPFGAEYSIFIKNLDTVRAVAQVSIDGQSVDESGEGFVIDANSSLDLERFLKGNMNKGNRFKFIERTGKIEDHRGIEVEDGLIRVEFQFEKRAPKVEEVHHYTRHYWHDDYWYDRYPYHLRRGPFYGSLMSTNVNGLVGGTITTSTASTKGTSSHPGVVCEGGAGAQGIGGAGEAVNLMNVSGTLAAGSPQYTFTSNAAGGVVGEAGAVMDSCINDVGLTVPGSISKQQFVTVGRFPLQEEMHVIVLKLLGETAGGKRIVQPVTVKSKQKCPTCGHMNKATAKFCAECGTGLEIV